MELIESTCYGKAGSHQALRMEMRVFANQLKNNGAEARKFLVNAGKPTVARMPGARTSGPLEKEGVITL